MQDLEKKHEEKLENVSTVFESKLTRMTDTVLQNTLSSVEVKINKFENQSTDYMFKREEAKEAKYVNN